MDLPSPSLIAQGLALGVTTFLYLFLCFCQSALDWLYPHRIYRLFGNGGGDAEGSDEPVSLPEWLRDQGLLRFLFGRLCDASVAAVVILGGTVLLPNMSLVGSIFVLWGALSAGQLLAGLGLRFMTLPRYEWLLEFLRRPVCILLPIARRFYRLGLLLRNEVPDEEEDLPDADIDQEVRDYIESSYQAGLIEETENLMMRRIMSLDERVVTEIMTARTDIIALPSESTREEVITLVADRTKSRIPVYDQTIDNIVGIFYVKDFVKGLADPNSGKGLKDLMRKPFAVPESKNLAELLNDFLSRKPHMAIVLDEYGGTSGLVTIEDVLEEIVGEIDDEHDPKTEKNFRPWGMGGYLIDGSTPVDLVEEKLAITIDDADFDSIGGFLLDHFEEMPPPEDFLIHQGWRFSVFRADDRRVRLVWALPAEEMKQEVAVGYNA